MRNKSPGHTRKKSCRLSPAARPAKLLEPLGLHTGKRVLNLLFSGLVIMTLMLYVWSIPSLYFNLPWRWLKISGAIIFTLGVPAALILFKPRRRTFLIISALCLAVTAWQQSIPPANDRDWKIPVARIPQIEMHGNEVRISNIRNFDYRSATDFTPRYYGRIFRIDELETLDYILSYWDGNKAIAHTILSFGFRNGDYLAVSVETRLAKKQVQSLLGGIFNQYELIYILADERDVIRLRTNFRKEQVYLYRLKPDIPMIRKVFLKIIRRAADLQGNPVFYNTVKQNCITTLLADVAAAKGEIYHFDYRFIMNGYSDALLYAEGVFVNGGYPFSKLKKLRHINQYVENDPDAATNYSSKIRPPGTGLEKPALNKTDQN